MSAVPPYMLSTPCGCCADGQKSEADPWNLNYEWLGAALWVLEAKPRSSARENAFNW